jgi:MFS family permease
VGIVVLFALGNSSDLFLLFYGRSRFDIGLSGVVGLWILLHISKMVWSVPGGMLSDRHGRRVVIVAGWLVYALVYLGLAFVDESWQLWALMAVYGLFYGLTEGAEKALVTDLVPAELRGTALGLHAGAVGFAALPASLVFGVFWSVIGPRLAFGIGASLAALASVLLVLHSRRRAR